MMCLVYGCDVDHAESHPVTAAASVAAQQRIQALMRDRIDQDGA